MIADAALCCGAYVCSWHLATFRCDASIRSLLGVKRTLRARKRNWPGPDQIWTRYFFLNCMATRSSAGFHSSC